MLSRWPAYGWLVAVALGIRYGRVLNNLLESTVPRVGKQNHCYIPSYVSYIPRFAGDRCIVIICGIGLRVPRWVNLTFLESKVQCPSGGERVPQPFCARYSVLYFTLCMTT